VSTIRRTLFASVYHLPPEDRRRLPMLAMLRVGEPWLSVLDEGAMIRVPADLPRLGEYCAMAERIGFSSHFRALLDTARREGCQYLHLDVYGPRIASLVSFESVRPGPRGVRAQAASRSP